MNGASAKTSYDGRMALSRTGRLGVRGLVLGTCVVLAACGFAGLGSAPTGADLEGGAGSGSGSGSGDGAAGDGNPAFLEGGVIMVGGDGGGGGDAAVDADAKAPDDAGFTCPSSCTSCTGTTCNILCDLTHPCLSPITCPPGLPCHVTCNSLDVCSLHTISCSKATSCLVDCTQFHACQTMGVDCGNGACRLDCTGFTEACVSVNLNAPNAASLCLRCEALGGFPGCQSTDGTKPQAGRPCTLVCTGGGCNATGNGIGNCSQPAACP